MTGRAGRYLADLGSIVIGPGLCLLVMTLPHPFGPREWQFLWPNVLFIAGPKLVGWAGLRLTPAGRAARFGAMALADVFALTLTVWFDVWPNGGDIAWVLYPVGVIPVMLTGAAFAGVCAERGGPPGHVRTRRLVKSALPTGLALVTIGLLVVATHQRRWSEVAVPVDLRAGTSQSFDLTVPARTRYRLGLAVDRSAMEFDRLMCLMNMVYEPCGEASPLKLAGTIRSGGQVVATFPSDKSTRGGDASIDEIRLFLDSVELHAGHYHVDLRSQADASALNVGHPRLVADAADWDVHRGTKAWVGFVAFGTLMSYAGVLALAWVGLFVD